ncbi:hypothetical protein IHE49_05305 [Rhodanobacter sp. 7MK24]|uniref:hypothetical protein n=1 Tax=Rhodanobacter sp. 7MK24 TaxID=2775922 RepID=UPI00177E31B3|nr:hypothetical protein [Rhodanobacter sp. 7MK24]MBD8879891.1 hypothetical protein [Rhodanobacter sp. 7MK24]
MNAVDPVALRKSRLKLLLVASIFAAPFVLAMVLTLAGWQPTAKGNGLPVRPQRNFAQEQVPVRLADGSTWAWRDSEPRLTLVALPGPDCAARCYGALTAMAKARVMLNRNQSRLRLLYVGTPPADARQREGMANYWKIGEDVGGKLAPWRPGEPDSVGALLVESDGTALASYPAGFDASGLLQDMQKVIK